MVDLTWVTVQDEVDWQALSELYRIAPLGNKPAKNLEIVFSNSMYKCFVYAGDQLVGVGRALADGLDCSYICDIAIHPEFQGIKLGKAIVDHLVEKSQGHKKIILYANPGKEGFYQKLGFHPMKTAMAIFADHAQAVTSGIIAE
ncbi:GNAT family N-acetyltransferase [Undibacterium sp. Ji83W]|uniref:GNAT family N-acetyltransferase n=1 Tax=Undibacterium sp. Ji83W TaxID=3413043 RepID=UPI003BF0557C